MVQPQSYVRGLAHLVRAATVAPPSSQASDRAVAIGTVVVLVLVGLAVALVRARARRGPVRARPDAGERRGGRGGRLARSGPRSTAGRVALVAAVAAVVAGAVIVVDAGSSGSSSASALARNPELDPGQVLGNRPAPGFTLRDQSGRTVSLRSFRGKVTVLAFTDAECTTICPLTTTAMLDAQRMLGGAARQVQLLGVNANPRATAIDDVLRYTQLHGLLGHWRFLTGSPRRLRAVWRAYGIASDIRRGLIDHTPALFVIDPQGRMRTVYITQQSYSSVGQLGQILARRVASLLPGHPSVDSHLTYAPVSAIAPTRSTTLARAGGGRIALGPGRARLYVFFDTWDRQSMNLAHELDALNGYAAGAARGGLPPLTAVDEASVEPSPAALPAFLRGLPSPLRYPVAIDATGRLADGYQVQGAPWLVLVSARGRIAWYDALSSARWPTVSDLRGQVRAALAPAPAGSASGAAQLSGSPAPLAALHAQASRLIGSEPALLARIRALRGYPIVVNAWASWCDNCRAEAPLLAAASERYGRQVAFLGADTSDAAGDAAAFQRRHPVSYPSYSVSSTGMSRIAPGGIQGLPTTIFINRAGRVTFVHNGVYDAQGTLDADVRAHALGAG